MEAATAEAASAEAREAARLVRDFSFGWARRRARLMPRARVRAKARARLTVKG